MADPTQIVLLPSEESALAATPLFPGSYCVYSNGRLAQQCLDYDDAVVIGPDAEWLESTCSQLAKLEYKRVRYAEGDISQIEGDPLEWVRARIKPYESSAQQVGSHNGIGTSSGRPADAGPIKNPAPQPADINPPAVDDSQAADAGPSEDAPERDLSALDDSRYMDEDDAVEAAQRSMRNASALKSAAASEEWFDPADFWGVRPILPFDTRWILPSLRSFVTNAAAMVGCDPGITWLQTLAFAAGCLNDEIKVRVRPNQDWAESARIWACIVGDSGDGKSPSMKTIMRETRDLQFEIAQRSKDAFSRYKDDVDLYDLDRKAWLSKRQKGEPCGERPTAPTKPVNELLFFNSTTSEGLLEQQEQSLRGTMCEADEFLGWLLGMDQYKSGGKGSDRQFWLSAWDGSPFIGILVGKMRHIPNTGVTIIGGSQPDALRRAAVKLNLESDGLIQRVIVYNSTGLADEDSEQPADREAIAQWKRIVSRLYAMKTNPQPCAFSDGGNRIRREAGEWIAHVRSIQQFPAAARQALSKWRAYLPRIALTMHAIECAREGREAITDTIEESTVALAWAYMRDCLWPHMLHFYSTINEYSDADKSVKAFAEYVLAREVRTIKPHKLNSAWSNVKKGMSTVQWRELWAQIEAAGWARPIGTPVKSTGLSSEYAVNPLAFDGRFDGPAKLAREAVEIHRAAMHPAFLARQGRQPGED